MLFSKSVPEEVSSYPTTKQFLDVLDSLHLYKQGIIAEALRANNPLICLDEIWLLRYLSDNGFTKVPEGIPVLILQQMALNADIIFRLRGSLLGLQILCNICTLGFVEVDTSDFIKDFKYLLPNSTIDGFITDSNDQDTWRYLIDNNKLNKDRSLTITISGGIRNDAIEQFLNAAVEDYVGFHPNCTITIQFQDSRFSVSEVYHDFLNKRFINSGSNVYSSRRSAPISEEDIKTI